MRNKASTNTIKKLNFFGVPQVVAPIFPEEFQKAGFNQARPTKNYVQDDSRLNPFQKAVIFAKKQHLIINCSGTNLSVRYRYDLNYRLLIIFMACNIIFIICCGCE